MFIDQIIDRNLDTVLSWKIIQLINRTTGGPVQKCYTKIKDIITNGTNILKKDWENLSQEKQHYNFLSNKEEQDKRKVNWYLKVNKDNINVFTWVRRKGNLQTERQEQDQYYYTIIQSTKPGYTSLKRCEECITNPSTRHQNNNVQLSEICKLNRNKKTKLFSYNIFI